jgi:hypothetical protein
MKGTFADPAEATPAAWTDANFDKLKWNRSRAEVRALFGPPQEISGGMVIDLVPGLAYVWKQGGNEITATFQGDRLYEALATLNGKTLQLRSKPTDIPEAKLPVGPSKLTEANFRKVKQNMTPAQVCAIFGEPQYEGPGGSAFTWLDARGNNAQVLFADGKAVIATAVINGKNFTLQAGP